MNMAMCYTEIKSREVKGRWYDMTDNMRDIILKFSQQVNWEYRFQMATTEI